LLGRPDILLLDEADANLDPISAHRLGKIITAFTGTVLMVTHQLSRITQADEIWYVEAGRLLESGTPDELLGRSSRTRRLFRRELKEVG
jgi:ABC-type multidrug transport system fused ATPase/permease subunit